MQHTPDPQDSAKPTTRAIVAALRSDDRVIVGSRRSPLRLTYVAAVRQQHSAVTAVIRDQRLVFAIGRHVGNAVARNRCRRRVRAAFTVVLRDQSLPNGGYLFRPTAKIATMPFTEVVELVASLGDQLNSQLAREGVPA